MYNHARQLNICAQKELQEFANSAYDQLPLELRSSVELACEKGAFLSSPETPMDLPSIFAFHDGLLFCYHWTPPACPTS